MAHDCTRGTWTCFESRQIPNGTPAGGYTTPSQSKVPLDVKFALVFADPVRRGELSLCKAVPREWLAAGETVRVANAPTVLGRVDLNITSERGGPNRTATISATVRVRPTPASLPHTSTMLYLRAPVGLRLAAVEVDGRRWDRFSAADERIELPVDADAGGDGQRRHAVLATFAESEPSR